MTQLGWRLRRAVRRLLPRKMHPWHGWPDDVYIVSYPRSGNTWLRRLLAHTLEPNRDWDVTVLDLVVPDVYHPWPQGWIERRPRIVKSHEPYQPSYQRVIYLYRDGRDVAVSYYDYLTKVHGYRGSFDFFLTEFLTGGLPYGSWSRHVSSWVFEEHPIDLLSVRYEAMVADTIGQLHRVSNFLDASWSQELLEAAVAKSSLKQFRNEYRTLLAHSHWSQGFQGGVKGGPGKWREVFTPQQHNRFWKAAGGVAERLGYSPDRVPTRHDSGEKESS